MTFDPNGQKTVVFLVERYCLSVNVTGKDRKRKEEDGKGRLARDEKNWRDYNCNTSLNGDLSYNNFNENVPTHTKHTHTHTQQNTQSTISGAPDSLVWAIHWFPLSPSLPTIETGPEVR